MPVYTQSETKLYRIVIYHLPTQLTKRYPEDTILLDVKPLYDLSEVGNY